MKKKEIIKNNRGKNTLIVSVISLNNTIATDITEEKKIIKISIWLINLLNQTHT